ncbi:alpha/beta fold hydrolase [Micromonospora zingiberis]|uniref:alpha/beta fold hydrolase n=1 Tax=Micromonospora zingiberis TaxID=2053011 RepID=UPI001F0EA92D|nr:alpha/beta hydrolase [Micromonospora zingiberis]
MTAWVVAAWHATRLRQDGEHAPRRTRILLAALAAAAAAALSLSIQHLGRLGFYLDDQKAWPGSALAVLPPLVIGVAVTYRLRERGGPGLPPAWWVRSGLYSSLALTAFELFPHGRLRAVDVFVPLTVTVLAGLADAVASRRPAWRLRSAATAVGVTGLGLLTLVGSLAVAVVTAPGPAVPDIPPVPVRASRIDAEGDSLYFEARGNGPPLLLIAGAGGDGGYYERIADLLATSYEVITYDRRGNARSTRHHPTTFSFAQQARDAVAVLTAAGHRSATVVGSSGGALVGLQLVVDHPAAVRKLLIHEAPLPSYDRRWATFLHAVASTRLRYGSSAATLQFLFGLGIPASAFGATPPDAQSRGYDEAFVIGTELAALFASSPDIRRITASGVPVLCAVGELSRRQGRLQATGMPQLAADLNAPLLVFPGHHLSYQDDPAGWASALRAALAG